MKIKPNLSLHWRYYAEACNGLVGPHLRINAPASNAFPFEEMLQKRQVVDNNVSDLTGPRRNIKPPTPEMNALRLTVIWFYYCKSVYNQNPVV